MPQPPILYATLLPWFKQAPWRDGRHLKTLCGMVAGRLTSGWIALDEWAPGVAERAVYAQSTVRRFSRWLSTARIDALRWYAALLRGALGEVPDGRRPVALDTTRRWDPFCGVPVAWVWRGRSLPVAGKVRRHRSASGAFQDDRGVLGFAARRLQGREVVLLADRGFIQAELWRWVTRTPDGHFGLRGQRDIGLFLGGGKTRVLRLSAGERRFSAGVFLGAARIPVELAVGWEKGAKAPWSLATAEAAGPPTRRGSGLRCGLEEGLLDHNSGGFQWESSRRRDAEALQRRCLVLATATLVLGCHGAVVVATGRRREVDPHGLRGLRSARLGWTWIRRVLARGGEWIGKLPRPPAGDPAPARASRRQPDRSRWREDLPCHYWFLCGAPSMA